MEIWQNERILNRKILKGTSAQICYPNVLSQYAVRGIVHIFVAYNCCIYFLPKCTAQMCSQNVQPKCAAKMCSQNVPPKCAAQMCHPNVPPKCAAQMCCPNVLSQLAAQIYCPNVLPKYAAQMCCPIVLPKYAAQIWYPLMTVLCCSTRHNVIMQSYPKLVDTKFNGTTHFKKCKQLCEYQYLLLLRDIWWLKF
jgi:hypothetical protein